MLEFYFRGHCQRWYAEDFWELFLWFDDFPEGVEIPFWFGDDFLITIVGSKYHSKNQTN